MKPYSPPTDIGRTVAADDVHHRTADQPRKSAKVASKALKHSARQHAEKSIRAAIAKAGG